MAKKTINNVISYGYNASQVTTSLIHVQIGCETCQYKVDIEMEATSNTRSQNGMDCLTTIPRIYLYKTASRRIIKLIRIKRAWTLKLVLREHEQGNKSHVD